MTTPNTCKVSARLFLNETTLSIWIPEDEISELKIVDKGWKDDSKYLGTESCQGKSTTIAKSAVNKEVSKPTGQELVVVNATLNITPKGLKVKEVSPI